MSWQIEIRTRLRSLNELLRLSAHQRRDLQKHFANEVFAGRVSGRIPRAVGPRRLTICRYAGRDYDYDNFVGGCKLLLDTLVDEGLLQNDSTAQVLATYRQERRRPGQRHDLVLVQLDDVPTGV